MTNKRHTGKIKWFNETKGFGFITPDDMDINNGKDVFLHITAVKSSGLRSVDEGQTVEFALEEQRGKPAAVDLKAIEQEAA